MTLTAALNVMKVPGSIVIDPTADPPLSPNGGVSLGRVVRVRARRLARTFYETAEGFGGATTDAINLGEEWILAFALRGWNEDALSYLFPRTATVGDDVMVRAGVADSGSGTEGTALTRRKVLFVPDDEDKAPAVYFQEAVLELLEPLELVLDRSEELLTAFAFRALMTSTPEKAVQIGKLRGISL